MDLLNTLAVKDRAALIVVSGTTHATNGSRFTITHGLKDSRGVSKTPVVAFGVATATDADGTLTAVDIRCVAKGATTCTFRCSGSSVPAEFFFA